MYHKPADEPAEVVADEGEVQVEGPDGIRYSFTPRAAVETSDRLLRSGMEAEGQLSKANLLKRAKLR